jgi:hypothetical protein
MEQVNVMMRIQALQSVYARAIQKLNEWQMDPLMQRTQIDYLTELQHLMSEATQLITELSKFLYQYGFYDQRLNIRE